MLRNQITVSTDEIFPNVYYIDRNAKPILIQVSIDQYELRQGRYLIGMVVFHNGNTKWGWRFIPHQTGKPANHILYPNPEAAVKRYVISEIFPLKWNHLAKD